MGPGNFGSTDTKRDTDMNLRLQLGEFILLGVACPL